MGVLEQPVDVSRLNNAEDAGCSQSDDAKAAGTTVAQQAMDPEFLDAICNGILVVGKDFNIVAQNYVSRVNMGHLIGQRCYRALESRDAPCERCPLTHAIEGEYEMTMRCAGKSYSLYEVRLYPLEKGTKVVEVYPDMIDRELLIKNLDMYREELDLLKDVVRKIQDAVANDLSKS